MLWLYTHETADFELKEATIESLHHALFSGKVTCAQIVEEYIDRINKYDHLIHSVHLINPHATSRAIELDQLPSSQKVNPSGLTMLTVETTSPVLCAGSGEG